MEPVTKHLPEWIMKRYSKLWIKFREKEFTRKQVLKIFPNDKSIAVFLSELRKSGWLEIKISEKDARKTIYKLKNPAKTILEEIREMGKK